MNMVILSCRKVTELMEKKYSFKLTAIERVQLFMHTSMCDGCRNYFEQSEFMDKTLKEHSLPGIHSKTIIKKSLPSHVKEKIIKELERKK